MRGLESSLPTPLASAAVMKKSMAKFGERCEKPKPLVGDAGAEDGVQRKPDVTPLPEADPLGDRTLAAAGILVQSVTPLPPTAGAPANKRAAAGRGTRKTKFRTDVLRKGARR